MPRLISCRYGIWNQLDSSQCSRRRLVTLSRKKAPQPKHTKIHPGKPARTRFAPSPTGFLHLGGLRTALYNYLLAKNTGGQFLLRIEDTDPTRCFPEAKKDILDSLRWAGLQWDEGPEIGGPYGPYIQSERLDLYNKYANKLLESGHAYRCFCSSERLDSLRTSAQLLMPPSLATYDRHCSHLSSQESDQRAINGDQFTIRFKAPEKYDRVHDLLHGMVDLQTQVNYQDRRYDDAILLKSDGYPTYHLANVVDDKLMDITHVVRGEEWLTSTPKHITLYKAFGWDPPEFVHIPLMFGASGKKLSKRTGDIGVRDYIKEGILPEALLNYVVLFGWAPKSQQQQQQQQQSPLTPKPRPHPFADAVSQSEIFDLPSMVKAFSLDGLSKSNSKVTENKLNFFNKYYLQKRLEDPEQRAEIVNQSQKLVETKFPEIALDDPKLQPEYIGKLLDLCGNGLTSVEAFPEMVKYFYRRPEYDGIVAKGYRNRIQPLDAVYFLSVLVRPNMEQFKQENNNNTIEERETITKESLPIQWSFIDGPQSDWTADNISKAINQSIKILARGNIPFYQALRFAIFGSVPGAKLPIAMELLGRQECLHRVEIAISYLLHDAQNLVRRKQELGPLADNDRPVSLNR